MTSGAKCGAMQNGRVYFKFLRTKGRGKGMDTLFQKANNVFAEAFLGPCPAWISPTVFFSTLPHLGLLFIKRRKDLTEELG